MVNLNMVNRKRTNRNKYQVSDNLTMLVNFWTMFHFITEPLKYIFEIKHEIRSNKIP